MATGLTKLGMALVLAALVPAGDAGAAGPAKKKKVIRLESSHCSWRPSVPRMLLVSMPETWAWPLPPVPGAAGEALRRHREVSAQLSEELRESAPAALDEESSGARRQRHLRLSAQVRAALELALGELEAAAAAATPEQEAALLWAMALLRHEREAGAWVADLEAGTGARTAHAAPRLGTVIAPLERLLARHPSFAHAGRARLLLGHCQAAAGNLEAAQAAWKSLAESASGGDLAGAAWFELGWAHFNARERDSLERATLAFEKAAALAPALEERALYLRAWSLYRMDALDRAADGFARVLDLEGELRGEAMRFLAVTLSDCLEGGPGRLAALVERTGAKSWEPELTRRVADSLAEQADEEAAIALYRRHLERWPDDRMSRRLVQRIVRGLERLRDLEGAAAERARLAAYAEGSPWHARHKGDAEALADDSEPDGFAYVARCDEARMVEAVRARSEVLSACLASAGAAGEPTPGAVRVSLLVRPDGNAAGVTVEASPARFTGCARSALAGIAFPKPEEECPLSFVLLPARQK